MLSVRLDSAIPLVDQLQAGIRTAIARGLLAPGDQLPPVRQLAGDLGINLNTVARAYRGLESSGLVVTSRGRGTRVTAATNRLTAEEARAQTTAALERAVTDARLGGLDYATFHDMFLQISGEIYGKEQPHG